MPRRLQLVPPPPGQSPKPLRSLIWGAHALGAAAYAAKAVALSNLERPERVQEEIRWQVAQLDGRERAALRLHPALGTDSSGPLGAGLLSRGLLGETIRQIQAQIR